MALTFKEFVGSQVSSLDYYASEELVELLSDAELPASAYERIVIVLLQRKGFDV